jgi:hypothetical protein
MSIRAFTDALFPDTATTRDINKAQIYAGRKASNLYYIDCASWRWKAPKSKAACPARCKEKNDIIRVSAINWNKIEDDKD